MKVYIKFFTYIFLKSLFFVFAITFSLVLILNVMTELDFFKDTDIKINLPILKTFLNSRIVFDMFPFIFLVMQVFY